jgi:hypothetical protein
MSTTIASIDEELERRIEVVSHDENQGEQLTRGDHRALLAVTLLVPFLLLVWAWFS